MHAIIITAPWDHYRKELENLCEELISYSIDCRIMNYEDPEAVGLLLKYGIEDGMIKIPKIFLVINNQVIEIKYELHEDLTTNMKENIMRIIKNHKDGLNSKQ